MTVYDLLYNKKPSLISNCYIFSYWTPSRCAKILIDKDVQDLPADLFIFVKVGVNGFL